MVYLLKKRKSIVLSSPLVPLENPGQGAVPLSIGKAVKQERAVKFFPHISIASSCASGKIGVAYLPGARHTPDLRSLHERVCSTFPCCSLTARVRHCYQPPQPRLPAMKLLFVMLALLFFWDPALAGKMGIWGRGESFA